MKFNTLFSTNKSKLGNGFKNSLLMLTLASMLCFSCNNEKTNTPNSIKPTATKVDTIFDLFMQDGNNPKVLELIATLDSAQMVELENKINQTISNLEQTKGEQEKRVKIQNNHLSGQGTKIGLNKLKKNPKYTNDLLTLELDKNKLEQNIKTFLALPRMNYQISTTFDEPTLVQAETYVNTNYQNIGNEEQLFHAIVNDFTKNWTYANNGEIDDSTIANALYTKTGDCDIQSTSILYIFEALKRKGFFKNIVAIFVPGDLNEEGMRTKPIYTFSNSSNHTWVAFVINTGSEKKILCFDPINTK